MGGPPTVTSKAQRGAALRSPKCPHCGGHHPSDESVRICGLQRSGYRWLDADGYLANGPYTRPDLDHPKKPVRLLRTSCSTCRFVRVRADGSLSCSHDSCLDAAGLGVDILVALDGACENRRNWQNQTPPGRVDSRQIGLFDE